MPVALVGWRTEGMKPARRVWQHSRRAWPGTVAEDTDTMQKN